MSQNLIQPSFSAGELSPQLFARVDLSKYHVGLAFCRNFFVDFRGGVSNRPGQEFCGVSLSNAYARVVKFQYSSADGLALEFTPNAIRPLRKGAFILNNSQLITSVTNNNPGLFNVTGHGYTTGQQIELNGFSSGFLPLQGETFYVQVVDANHFTLTDYFGNPVNTTSYGVYPGGGTVASYVTIATPYAGADLQLLKFAQSNNVVTITHPSYPPYFLSRTTDQSWSLTKLTFGTTVSPPTVNNPAITGGTSTASYSYVVTAWKNGQQSPASSPVQVSGADIGAAAGSVKLTWTGNGADYYYIYKDYAINQSFIPNGSRYGYIQTVYGTTCVDNNYTPNYSQTPPQHGAPFDPGQILSVTVTTPGTSYPITGAATVTITDPTGSGFVGLPIIDASGNLTGVLVENGGINYTNPTVHFSSTTGTAAVATAQVGASTGTYPSVSAYFQQRQLYANSNNSPQTLWGSKLGYFQNFDTSSPSLDTDAYSFTLGGTQVNNICWMINMPGGLVIFTSGSIWQVNGGGLYTPVTPSNVIANAQSYTGCSNTVQPIPINYEILYVQNEGITVNALSYNFYANIYTKTDITVLSSHLFTAYTIVEWAYCNEPFRVIWCVRSDGTLLACTYLKEQELIGWSHCDTQGLYKSVCVVLESGYDVLYCVVQRYINGQTFNFIERQVPRILSGPESAMFLDAAVSSTLTPYNANMTMDSPTGISNLTFDAPVANALVVGNYIRAAGGVGIIATVTDSQHCSVNWIRPVQNVYYDVYGNAMAVPVASGTWTSDTPVNTVYGLNHLNGQTVQVFADGLVQRPKTVVNGSITLDRPSSNITVGLGYLCQIQSLYLDAGSPTIQGKRKKIDAITLRVADSRSVQIGETFSNMYSIKEPLGSLGIPPEFYTGDERIQIATSFNVGGQICIQQALPLPVTLLGLIPEITVGDT